MFLFVFPETEGRVATPGILSLLSLREHSRGPETSTNREIPGAVSKAETYPPSRTGPTIAFSEPVCLIGGQFGGRVSTPCFCVTLHSCPVSRWSWCSWAIRFRKMAVDCPGREGRQGPGQVVADVLVLPVCQTRSPRSATTGASITANRLPALWPPQHQTARAHLHRHNAPAPALSAYKASSCSSRPLQPAFSSTPSSSIVRSACCCPSHTLYLFSLHNHYG